MSEDKILGLEKPAFFAVIGGAVLAVAAGGYYVYTH